MICVLRGSYEQFSIILAKGEKKAVQCCRMTLKTKAPTVWAALQEVSSISCSGLCQSPRTLWAHHNWKHERNYSKNSWKHVYLLWRKIWKLPKQNQTLFHFAFVFPFLQVQWWKLKKADLKKKKKNSLRSETSRLHSSAALPLNGAISWPSVSVQSPVIRTSYIHFISRVSLNTNASIKVLLLFVIDKNYCALKHITK